MRAIAFCCLAFALVLSSGGCSPKKVKVTGTVLKNGKPLEVSKAGVEVILIPEAVEKAQATNFPTRLEADGTFAVADVPPGKYKIAVQQLDNPTDQRSDRLKGAFSPEKTAIRRDIDGKTPLTIDVDKPGG